VLNTYATFWCRACELEFAERLPALHEDLPFCPECGAGSSLKELLCARSETWSSWCTAGAVLSVIGLVQGVMDAWPF
jgi:hypothetical protein